MRSRRGFLKMGAAAAFSVPLAGQQPASSLRSRVRPIEPQEYEARRARGRELMAANRLDAVFLMGGSSLHYFTGMNWGRSERLFALVFPRRGDPVYIVPAFEEGRATEVIRFGKEVRIWQEDESPYRLAAQALRDLRVGTLGMEETVPYFVTSGISRAAAGVSIVSADPVTAGCRMIKSARELELMELAAEATLQAFRSALSRLHEGMTAAELREAASAGFTQQGLRGGALVGFGAFAAFPHGSVSEQRLKSGEIVLMDGGCSVEGYQSDVTRTTVLGKPTDRQRQVWDVVKKAQQAALAAARPGVAAEAVDAAARRVIEDAGFGPGYRSFTHRVGHGIGLDGHEWPYLVQGNKLPLAPGMTFSDEPGVYIRGEMGVRLEDVMVITGEGARLLTKPSASIEEPFG